MPDSKDRFDGKNCFIITNPSKTNFHLYGDDPAEIKIADIANALSKQVRFTGHLFGECWYSVAEHCLITSAIVCELGGSKEEQFCALMHDTPEAYLADIAAPFKHELGNYYEKEALIWKRIAAKYGIPEVLPEIVKRADWIALFLEARHMVVPDNPKILESWVGWSEYGPASQQTQVRPWMMVPVQAKTAWLNSFTQMHGI